MSRNNRMKRVSHSHPILPTDGLQDKALFCVRVQRALEQPVFSIYNHTPSKSTSRTRNTPTSIALTKDTKICSASAILNIIFPPEQEGGKSEEHRILKAYCAAPKCEWGVTALARYLSNLGDTGLADLKGKLVNVKWVSHKDDVDFGIYARCKALCSRYEEALKQPRVDDLEVRSTDGTSPAREIVDKTEAETKWVWVLYPIRGNQHLNSIALPELLRLIRIGFLQHIWEVQSLRHDLSRSAYGIDLTKNIFRVQTVTREHEYDTVAEIGLSELTEDWMAKIEVIDYGHRHSSEE